MSAGSQSFSLDAFRRHTDDVGRSIALPETEIIEALVRLRNSNDPLADTESRNRLAAYTSIVLSNGQRLSDYLSRYGFDARVSAVSQDKTQHARRTQAASERAQARLLRRELPGVMRDVLPLMPETTEIAATIEHLASSAAPFEDLSRKQSVALLVARIDFVADLLRSFLAEAGLLDHEMYCEALAAMKDSE